MKQLKGQTHVDWNQLGRTRAVDLVYCRIDLCYTFLTGKYRMNVSCKLSAHVERRTMQISDPNIAADPGTYSDELTKRLDLCFQKGNQTTDTAIQTMQESFVC